MRQHAVDLTLPRQASHVPTGRNAMAWLAPVLGDRWNDVRLVVTELLGNAVRHGVGEEMRLRVVATDRDCRIEVTDGGHGFDPPPPADDPYARGGRGLGLVDHFAREWGVETGSTRVYAVLDLTPAERR